MKSEISQGLQTGASSLPRKSRCQVKSGLKKIAKPQRKGNLRREINNLKRNSLKKNKEKTTDAEPPSHPAFQDCRSVDEFQYLNRIDEGAFGVVHRARDRQTGEEVALKQLKNINQREGLSIAARRELEILIKMKHPNIVAGGGIAVNSLGEEVFIVMEYVDYDLKSFLETMCVNGQMFSTEHVKCLMTQLLRAVQHLHDHQIIHRDMKTSNVLLSGNGVLKVADFGLARECESTPRQYTPGVVTRWYRAPELLLLSSEYSTPIDMWSVGCIFVELITLQPLFPGKSEVDQLDKVFKELGTPSDTIWPGFSALPLVKNIVFHNYPPGGLRKRINDGKLSCSGFSLLHGLLAYDPAKRMTAFNASEHGFFKEDPVAIEPAEFLTEHSTPVDMWSVECILAELITLQPLFPGTTENWARRQKQFGPATMLYQYSNTLFSTAGGSRKKINGGKLSDCGFSLLQGLLTYNPSRRVTAADAIEHSYFKEEPVAIEPDRFPISMYSVDDDQYSDTETEDDISSHSCTTVSALDDNIIKKTDPSAIHLLLCERDLNSRDNILHSVVTAIIEKTYRKAELYYYLLKMKSEISQGLQNGASSLPRKSRCQVKSGLKKIAKHQRKGNLRREINNLKRNSLKKNKEKTTDAEPPSHPAFQDCRSVDEFQYLNRIDEGAFGVVHRARDRQTGEEVALKQLKNINQREGLSIAARRELEILIKMKHPNIVAGGGIAVNSLGEEVFIVMEYVDYDLKSFLETMRVNGQMFSTEHVKCLMTQLLRAVQHLHDHQIIHRDMKTSNVLLSGNGVLKVADFGLARECESTPRQYTPGVVTRWYRAPELLLLSSEYSTPIDMWSVGCIFVELITLQPLFPGNSEVDQLDKVFKELGTPSDTIWPGFSALPLAKNIVFHNYPPGGLRKRINDGKLSCSGFSLLHGLLAYDPAKRMTAFNASEHGFFKEDPQHRAPELLRLSRDYPTPVDMWSVGCILAELITLQPLFPGTTEVDHLDRIFKELGTPRMTAVDALEHAYFKEEPVAIEPYRFPISISLPRKSRCQVKSGLKKIAKHQRKGNLRREINNLKRNSLKTNKEKTTDAVPPSHPAFQDCRSVDEFQYLNRIDEGAFGVVHRARDRQTGEEVALKQLKNINQREGLSIAARRELEILIKMKHPNIVAGGGIAVNSLGEEVFIVMEYVDYDLKSFLETMCVNGQMFSTEHVKCLMTQLLRAVQHLHDHQIIHRDMKTSNVLLSGNGVLKVADFGLARECESTPRQYTPGVVTRWYRAPELLLLSSEYSTPIDMWSVGCIFVELITLQPLFPGKSEVDQLDKVFKELGTPSDTIWPGFSALPLAKNIVFHNYPPGGLRKRINDGKLSCSGFSLLHGLLAYDPAKRMTAFNASEHGFFKEDPVAIEPAEFLTRMTAAGALEHAYFKEEPVAIEPDLFPMSM
ncbi:hypothetical protein HW555_001254 [Spodoptera exigua]|uniref:Protein kinase domain-containing protein n=1 Tax=Spodoptera exigua TaxID=7107 RepID=A0A835GTB9_SPOEX|nr:hypothetical protein HW555_001254 [Spodoptera exigua]